jgi:hypothetical protein
MASIDQNEQSLADYLLKILTIVVRKAGGELRIAAVDMIDDNLDGLSKRYDREKRELVLTFISASTEVIRPCLDTTESPSSLRPSVPRSSILRPLGISPPMDSSISPRDRQPASTIDDERIADLEDHLRKQAAARLVANFPSTPVTAPRSRPLDRSSSQSSQPSQPPRRVQPSFFRD